MQNFKISKNKKTFLIQNTQFDDYETIVVVSLLVKEDFLVNLWKPNRFFFPLEKIVRPLPEIVKTLPRFNLKP